jgi:hypothetical protein
MEGLPDEELEYSVANCITTTSTVTARFTACSPATSCRASQSQCSGRHDSIIADSERRIAVTGHDHCNTILSALMVTLVPTTAAFLLTGLVLAGRPAASVKVLMLLVLCFGN